MEYVAKHYIKVDGRVRFPGEIFQKDYDEAAERRLIEAGAIRRADTTAPYVAEAAPVILKDKTGAQEAEDNDNTVQSVEVEAPNTVEPPTVDVEDAVVTAPKPKKNAKKEGKKE